MAPLADVEVDATEMAMRGCAGGASPGETGDDATRVYGPDGDVRPRWGRMFPACAWPEYTEVVGNLVAAAYRPPGSIRPDDPMATALDPAPTPPELTGPQPVDVYVRRASRRTGPSSRRGSTCSR